MMKKIAFIITLLLHTTSNYAQNNVGVLTKEALNSLHISGGTYTEDIGVEEQQIVGPTIRIESLNQTNNPDFFNNNEISTPLRINELGDLILAENIKTITPNFDIDELAFKKKTVKTSNTDFYTLNENLIIVRESIVHLQAPISIFLDHLNSANQVPNGNGFYPLYSNDNEDKRFYSYFKLTNMDDQSEIITGLSDEFLIYRSNRNNGASSVPNTVITESFIKLKPGTYTIEQHYGYDLGIATKSLPDFPGFMKTNPNIQNNNYSITIYPL